MDYATCTIHDADELERLASCCGFICTGTYLSDGKGGNLSLYQTWKSENVIV